MTSKLKCPVCNHKLYQTASEPSTYCCLYKDCQSDFKFAGSKELWQALIQAKQDLEIATKALKEIDTTRCIPQQTLISLGKFSKTTRFNAGNIICVATPDYIHNILKQISPNRN